MQAFTSLVAEHRAIQPLLVQFKVVLMQPPGEAAQVAAVRWRLLKALLDHFDREDREVCGSLVATGNVRAIDASVRFRGAFATLRELVMQYQGEWSSERILRDWAAFCDASHALLGEIEARVEDEEAELYPEAARLLKQVPEA